MPGTWLVAYRKGSAEYRGIQPVSPQPRRPVRPRPVGPKLPPGRRPLPDRRGPVSPRPTPVQPRNPLGRLPRWPRVGPVIAVGVGVTIGRWIAAEDEYDFTGWNIALNCGAATLGPFPGSPGACDPVEFRNVATLGSFQKFTNSPPGFDTYVGDWLNNPTFSPPAWIGPTGKVASKVVPNPSSAPDAPGASSPVPLYLPEYAVPRVPEWLDPQEHFKFPFQPMWYPPPSWRMIPQVQPNPWRAPGFRPERGPGEVWGPTRTPRRWPRVRPRRRRVDPRTDPRVQPRPRPRPRPDVRRDPLRLPLSPRTDRPGRPIVPSERHVFTPGVRSPQPVPNAGYRREPPPRGVSEKKRVPGWTRIVWRLIGKFTEGVDFVNSLYKALPKHCRNAKTFNERLRAVWRCFDQIDWSKALEEWFWNELQDLYYGRIGRLSARASKRWGELTGRPVGFGAGDADSPPRPDWDFDTGPKDPVEWLRDLLRR